MRRGGARRFSRFDAIGRRGLGPLGTKGLGAYLATVPDSKVRFDPRATVKNRWDSLPSNCIRNILIPSIRKVPEDVQSSFRRDKPSHVTPQFSGPTHEGDERDYARFLTCCF